MDNTSLNAATLEYIRRHIHDDVRLLALHTVPADVNLRAALTQIEGRQLASHKLPTWAAADGLLFPPRLAMEQCSSESTARYKRHLVQQIREKEQLTKAGTTTSCIKQQVGTPTTFIDLTAGLGVDFSTLASLFDKAIYVEQQQLLCDLALQNFPLLGLTNVEVRCSKAEENLQTRADLVLIDPARRDAAGRKVAKLEDCTPDVCQLQASLRAMAPLVLLKLSPMLDLTDALHSLQGIVEAHVVSVDGECKELLIVMQGTEVSDNKVPNSPPPSDEVPVYCVDISSSLTDGYEKTIDSTNDCRLLLFTRRSETEAPQQLADNLGAYLYEPHASILKAGAFKSVCQHYSVAKLAVNTHLYTSHQLVEDFPGRKWHILDSATFSKRDLHRLLQGISAADLTVRGFPASVATLRKQLRLREGGQTHLIATTLGEQRLLLKVERI